MSIETNIISRGTTPSHPIATIASGETVSFDLLDASCGQITAASTAADIGTLDFTPRSSQRTDLRRRCGTRRYARDRISRRHHGRLGLDRTHPRVRIACRRVSRTCAKDLVARGRRAREHDVRTRHPHSDRAVCGEIGLAPAARGALFSLGDGHAAQGDGEVCGTAIETPLQVTVRPPVAHQARSLVRKAPNLVRSGLASFCFEQAAAITRMDRAAKA